MRRNFGVALDWVLAHEGGYVDHPEDPGGATNLGITQATLSAFMGRQVSKAEVRNLTKATAAEIYRRDYWDRAQCDHLPDGLDYLVFDGAVNSGVSRSVRWLQSVVGVKADGIVGSHTLAAITKHPAGVLDIIVRVAQTRMRFLRGLRHWKTFGRGWTRRVMGTQPGAQIDDEGAVDRATALYHNEYVATPLVLEDGAGAKATETDVAYSSTVKTALGDKTVAGTAASLVTATLTAGSGDGPLAYAIAAVLVIAAIVGLVMLLRKT